MARVIISLLAQTDTTDIVTDLAEKAGYSVAAGYAASFEALYERFDLVCYKQWMRAAIPYIAVLIAIGLAIWFAVGNPL